MLEEQTKAAAIGRLEEQLGRVILGKAEVIDNVLVALLSGSHMLMEDVPGVGKTTLAKALAKSILSTFTRVQFTPDLLPTDILGSSIYNPVDLQPQGRKLCVQEGTGLHEHSARGRDQPRVAAHAVELARGHERGGRPRSRGRRGLFRRRFWSSRPRTRSSFTAPTRFRKRSSTASA